MHTKTLSLILLVMIPIAAYSQVPTTPNLEFEAFFRDAPKSTERLTWKEYRVWIDDGVPKMSSKIILPNDRTLGGDEATTGKIEVHVDDVHSLDKKSSTTRGELKFVFTQVREGQEGRTELTIPIVAPTAAKPEIEPIGSTAYITSRAWSQSPAPIRLTTGVSQELIFEVKKNNLNTYYLNMAMMAPVVKKALEAEAKNAPN